LCGSLLTCCRVMRGIPISESNLLIRLIFLFSTFANARPLTCIYFPGKRPNFFFIRLASSLKNSTTLLSMLLVLILRSEQAGFLAQKRLARGLQLNRMEAVALIATQLQERIRDGQHSVAELMHHGKTLLGRRHVLPSVPSLLHEIQVEGTFHDGYSLDMSLMILFVPNAFPESSL
jgi:urease gamma subunit